MSNLILFTNRSGSTVLTDIIAFNDNSINLGEGIHSMVRRYNLNSEANKTSELYKNFSFNIAAFHHNPNSRGHDNIGYFAAKQKRIDSLKGTNEKWTVKENLEKKTIDIPFIDYCVENNINLYMTHRRDIVAQFISKINARYRAEVLKHLYADFIFTNQTKLNEPYDEMQVHFKWLNMYTNVFLEQLLLWRVVYERYKSYVKVVSYENCIKPMDFSSLGICDHTVQLYKQQTQHLIPTPYNTDKLVVIDDHPKSIANAWDQCLYHVERHKYLVEI